jgi:hypothetical protein
MNQSATLQDVVPFASTQTMLILVGLVASGKVHMILESLDQAGRLVVSRH